MTEQTLQLHQENLVKSIPMSAVRMNQEGAFVYEVIHPPMEVHPNHVIALRMWGISSMRLQGAGTFFMLVPGKGEQKSAEVSFVLPESDWLTQTNLGVITLDLEKKINAIKMGVVIAFKSPLALPAGSAPKMSVETMWAEIYRV